MPCGPSSPNKMASSLGKSYAKGIDPLKGKKFTKGIKGQSSMAKAKGKVK